MSEALPGSPRVALVHDWLTGMRGGEKVLEVLAEMFPAAPIYTMLHIPGTLSPTLASHPIHTSWLQRLPLAATRYRYYLPLMPLLVERLRLEPVDLVVSTSHCVAKGIIPPADALHACYMHSPMRYIYDRFEDYFRPGRAGLLTRWAAKLCRPYLREWDTRTAKRVHRFAANSTFVRDRIQRIYGRRADVIFPPVETARYRAAAREPDDYYLIVSALVPYKNVDHAVEAFRGLDRKLVVAGSGPMLEAMQAAAPANVEFRGWVDDDELTDLVAGCRAFVFPNVEDFGIAPVEAMAAGRPIIALGQGGALDTVRDLDRWERGRLAPGPGPTGLVYDDPAPETLRAAIHRFEAVESRFRPADATAWAETFDRQVFRQNIARWLRAVLNGDVLAAPAPIAQAA